jgi:hypothetical protein
MKFVNHNGIDRKTKSKVLRELSNKFKEDCCICFELTHNKTNCGHVICRKCHDKVEICPICRSEIDHRFVKSNQKLIDRIMKKYGVFIKINNADLRVAIVCNYILLKYSFIEFKIGNTINQIQIILT